MSTENSIGAWEKATSTVASKSIDYGSIGRAKDTGIRLVDLNTASMVEFLRKTLGYVHDRYEFEELYYIEELINNYDKFNDSTTAGLSVSHNRARD